MKITYMLWNQSGVDSEIPKGQAWKWILHLEHEIEINLIFKNLKQKIVDENLVIVNLQIDQQCSSDDFLNIALESFKEPVTYDDFMPVARIISSHTETDSIFN
ncbi:MAG: hypothetical protein ACKVOY_00255 [Burkholderiaceae bacterium]|jgi:hypothetical protein